MNDVIFIQLGSVGGNNQTHLLKAFDSFRGTFVLIGSFKAVSVYSAL